MKAVVPHIDAHGNEGRRRRRKLVRGRRLSRLAALVAVIAIALATFVMIGHGGAESRAPAELASSQWLRLTGKIALAAEQVHKPRPEKVAAIASAQSELPEPGAAKIPARRRPAVDLDGGLAAKQAIESEPSCRGRSSGIR